jgi:hypothetical protein
MQIMIVGALGSGETELDQQAAHFCVRKASTDDRAMDAVMHVPDYRTPFGDRRGEDSSGLRNFIGIAVRETAGTAVCKPFENKADSKLNSGFGMT